MQTESFLHSLRDVAVDCGLHGDALTEPSVVMAPCDGSDGIAINGAVPWYPACTIKVPLALAVFDMIENGVLSADEEVVISADDVTDTLPPAPYRAGSRDSIINLVYHSVRFSDNVATNALMSRIDRRLATAIIRRHGLLDTRIARKLCGSVVVDDPGALGRNAHSARDAARLMQLIWSHACPGAEAIERFMMLEGDLSCFGLRSGDKLVHKNGYTDCVFHETGFVKVPNGTDYVFAVFTNLSYCDQSVEKMKRFLSYLRDVSQQMCGSSV